MSGSIFRQLSGRQRRRQDSPLPESTDTALRAVLRQQKETADKLAKLAQRWRARGALGSSYARELEIAMGWELQGDPMTGAQWPGPPGSSPPQ